MNGVRHSVELFKAFRHESTDPETFYGLLADDTVADVSRFCQVNAATVFDVGGASGYVGDAFRAAGARAVTAEYDFDQMTEHGRSLVHGVIADGCALPIATGSVDVSYSSNVLEHVGLLSADARRDGARGRPRRCHLRHIHQLALAVGRSRDLAVALFRWRVVGSPVRAQDGDVRQEPFRCEPVPTRRERRTGLVRDVPRCGGAGLLPPVLPPLDEIHGQGPDSAGVPHLEPRRGDASVEPYPGEP